MTLGERNLDSLFMPGSTLRPGSDLVFTDVELDFDIRSRRSRMPTPSSRCRDETKEGRP